MFSLVSKMITVQAGGSELVASIHVKRWAPWHPYQQLSRAEMTDKIPGFAGRPAQLKSVDSQFSERPYVRNESENNRGKC